MSEKSSAAASQVPVVVMRSKFFEGWKLLRTVDTRNGWERERERKKRSGWNDMTMMMTKLWKIATRENFRYSQAFVFSFSTIFSHSQSPTFVGTFHVARKQWKREKRVKHHGMEILCVVSTNKMKRWGEKRFPFEQFKSYLHSNLNHSPIKSHSLWR